MALSKQEAFLAAVSQDLMLFTQHAFHWQHPTQEFLNNWHIEALVNLLEQSIEGRQRRLIVNLPPRQLKSFVVSVAFPAFLLAFDPSIRIICVSYGEELAFDLARKTRRVLQSEWYRRLFPHVRLAKTSESEIETDCGGGRYATTVGGPLTGKGGDFIIIDDPVKPIAVDSPTAQDHVNEWYRNTLLSRLEDKARSVLILVMQRLHVNDLTGFIQNDPGFHKLSLPAIAVADEVVPLRHGKTYLREAGEPLHPEREDLETLRQIKAQMGSMLFAAQYQQNPATPDGEYFRREYFPIVDEAPKTTESGYYCISVDTAISQSDTADYTAFVIAYVTTEFTTVQKAERGRWRYEDLKARAIGYAEKLGRRKAVFLVEAVGFGHSLASYLRENRFICHPYRPQTSKMSRAAEALPYIEARRVRLCRASGGGDWIAPLLDELVLFPRARYDDQVDALVQLTWFARRNPHALGRYIAC